MKNRLLTFVPWMCLALLACDSGTVPISPESTGVGGASSASVSSSDAASSSSSGMPGGTGGAGGSSGSGGGLSCDPCVDHDGQRIIAKLKITQTPDGLNWTERVGWYDNQLKTECTYRLADDGQYRCMPLGNTLEFPKPPPIQKTVYLDSGCTQMLIERTGGGACVEPPKYANQIVPTQVPCTSSSIRLYALGPPWSTALVFTMINGQCVETAGSVNGYYILGEQVPASTFAAMTETIDP